MIISNHLNQSLNSFNSIVFNSLDYYSDVVGFIYIENTIIDVNEILVWFYFQFDFTLLTCTRFRTASKLPKNSTNSCYKRSNCRRYSKLTSTASWVNYF